MDSPLTCRLLPYRVADGAWNMAADELLLEAAVAGRASLRFYGWREPTVSLGYFQSVQQLKSDRDLAELPFVRRASGGDALVHHHEVTYCLALPAEKPWQSGATQQQVHNVVARALNHLGVEARLHRQCDADAFDGLLCYQHLAPCDVMVGKSKVVGSARRKRKDAVMQHGGVLLARSRHAPSLPGIRELSGRTIAVDELIECVLTQLQGVTGWTWVVEDWSETEHEDITCLVEDKFGNDAWNRKR